MKHKLFIYPIFRRSDGAAALEFATIGFVFLLLLISSIQFALIYIGQAAMSAGVSQAARQLVTFNTSSVYVTPDSCRIQFPAPDNADYIKCIVNNVTGSIFDQTKLQISAAPFSDYNSVTLPSACSAPGSGACTNQSVPDVPPGCNTTLPSLCAQNFGTNGQIVEYTVTYPWPLVVPIFANIIGFNSTNGGFGTFNISSSLIVRNEPDPTQNPSATSNGSGGLVITTTTFAP